MNGNIKCKIPGCTGLRKDGTVYAKNSSKGFCPKHYNSYRAGYFDIDGNKLKDPIRKTNKYNKTLSDLVSRTITVLHKNDQIDEKIDQEVENKNELFTTPINKEFHEKIHDIKDTRQFVQSSKFVIGNIEHLKNDVLRRIYNQSTGYVLPHRDPIGIPAIDQAKIARMIKEGKTDGVILLKIRGKYSLDRIKLLRKTLKNKKLV